MTVAALSCEPFVLWHAAQQDTITGIPVAVYRNKLTAFSPAAAAKRAGLRVGQSLCAARERVSDLTAGMVLARQKPPTAKGFAFFMLEDGSTRAQLTISPQLWAEHREMLQQARDSSLCQQARASVVTESGADMGVGSASSVV